MSRILALSDLHVDFPANMQYMQSFSNYDYTADTLIIAGDISDRLDHIETLLTSLKQKFHQVTFVPGNHEFWLRQKRFTDSIHKFEAIIALGDQLGVQTRPFTITSHPHTVQIIPLFSWYRQSEHDPDSLYIAKKDEAFEESPWTDDYLCRWPATLPTNRHTADYFAQLNEPHIHPNYNAPIITFSHTLPRRELMFGDLNMARQFANGRGTLPSYPHDPVPEFNFSRVAGCHKIEQQLRRLNAKLHIYGHQHRNRNRHIDGVTYVSKCLGYAREARVLGQRIKPQLIWQDGRFLQPEEYI